MVFQSAALMYVCSGVLILLGAAATFLFRSEIAASFGVSQMVTEEVAVRLPLYLVGYALICYSRTTISYFSAVDRKFPAGILTYAEPVWMLVFTSWLSAWRGVDGMWEAILLVYAIMAAMATAMLLIRKK